MKYFKFVFVISLIQLGACGDGSDFSTETKVVSNLLPQNYRSCRIEHQCDQYQGTDEVLDLASKIGELLCPVRGGVWEEKPCQTSNYCGACKALYEDAFGDPFEQTFYYFQGGALTADEEDYKVLCQGIETEGAVFEWSDNEEVTCTKI